MKRLVLLFAVMFLLSFGSYAQNCYYWESSEHAIARAIVLVLTIWLTIYFWGLAVIVGMCDKRKCSKTGWTILSIFVTPIPAILILGCFISTVKMSAARQLAIQTEIDKIKAHEANETDVKS